MKKILLTVALFLMIASPVRAESFYISDNVDIDVRTGQGYDYRIIALMHPGDRVETLKNEDGWSLVRLENGKEGWMLSRFLTKSRPAGPVLLDLQKEHRELQEEYSKAINENTGFKLENETLKTALDQKESERAAALESYEALKKGSTEFLEVSQTLDAANKELSSLKKRNGELEAVLVKLENGQWTKGLLTGAGILLAGILLGMISRKKRRRSSLL
ncbi:MAG: TIGR04211 family SH3 domain-containing protein [Desulfobacteraceae bacterium]|nr:TIGR04211 family SH3 domain-containing protein [Desulfobacteraceae bacterium]MBU4053808.1 TIGR04211 family SH3 domain-containing protein [Pseudomonadota bacterium]